MANTQNVLFRLSSINGESIKNNIANVDLSNLTGDNLVFQYRMETVIRLSAGEIVTIPSIKYSYGGKPLLEMSAHLVFSVQNLKSIIQLDTEKNEITVSADILPTIVSASYSSLRGLVYARTEGTPLGDYPLPMIEIGTLMSKNGISVEE